MKMFTTQQGKCNPPLSETVNNNTPINNIHNNITKEWLNDHCHTDTELIDICKIIINKYLDIRM